MRIEPSKDPVELDKRTNLPFVIHDECPECSNPFVADLSTVHYLSYPKVNSIIKFGCYCNECDHEWDHKLSLNVTLELVP
jgi:hypothetical protein